MQSWYLRFELAQVKPSICFVVITLPLSADGWYLSLSHTNTHTNTSLLPAQRTAYILAKDILKNALFPTYIDIYIYNFFLRV